MRRLGRRTAAYEANIPTAITGCCAWFASDLGVTTGTGGVAAWANQAPLTGSANDLVQSNSANRPSFQAIGVDFPNSPGVRFQSANSDILLSGTNAFRTGTGGNITQATVAVVLKHTGTVSSAMAASWKAASLPSSSGLEMYQSATTNTYVGFAAGNAGSGVTGATSALGVGSGTARLILVLGADATTVTLYQNGVAIGTTGDAGGNGLVLDGEEFSLGGRPNGSLFNDVSIAEVVCYNRALTVSEIGSLDTYLQRHTV